MGTERQLLRHTGSAKASAYLYVCLRDYSGDRIEGVCLISSRSAGMFVGHGAMTKNGLRKDTDNRGKRGEKLATWMLYSTWMLNKTFKNLICHLLLLPAPPLLFQEASRQSTTFICGEEEHLLSTDCTRHHKHESGI